MAVETETKLRVADLTPIRASLSRLSAIHKGACLEQNWVLDTPEKTLAKSGRLLRLRSTGGHAGVVTVKQPVKGGAFKTREEVETGTDDLAVTLRQFEMLGYAVDWRYEKYRDSWTGLGCVFALDRCPEIGSFVEIEGEPDAIRQAAGQLGLDISQHIGDSYLGLWMKHLKALGQQKRDMLFGESERQTLTRLD